MSDATIVHAFLARAAATPDLAALHLLGAGGADEDVHVTWQRWERASAAFAAALIDAGTAPGDTVAIVADNDLIWPIADLGVLRAGCVSVGIFPSSPTAQIVQILESCGARVVVAGSATQLAHTVGAAALVDGAIEVVSPSCATAATCSAWDEWMALGRTALGGAAGSELERRQRALAPEHLAALIYTSGSTGEPKGARITHRYIMASAQSIGTVLSLRADDRSLAFLPYSHAAERVFGHYTRIVYGMEAGLVPDHARVWDAARAFRPTIFGGLPRFYEKVVEQLYAETTAAERAAVLALGTERSRLRRSGEAVPPRLELQWERDGAVLLDRVRGQFGGALRLATSGGALLLPPVAETLDALGVTVLGAYGMTEHLCVAFNLPGHYAFDAVGPAMPGTDIRIADDGEILVRRCDLTFDGYYGDAAATEAAFTADGEWLHTGDLGTIDGNGMLRVTGRRKELIALSTGKKVAPLPIESRLAETPLIGQAMLYGEGRKFISALLTLRRAVTEQWAAARGIVLPWAELLEHPIVRAEVQRGIDDVNGNLSAPEQVRRFIVLDRELSAEHDELTPTLKLRRDVVALRFRDHLDALYQEA